MASYSDLLGQIVSRLNRAGDPGILTAATDFAQDRIYFYSGNYLFYPSEKVDTSLVLNPGQATPFYPLPAGTLEVLFVRINLGGTWIPLGKKDYRELLTWDVTTPPTQTVPSYYGLLGNKIRFFPRAGAVYTVELTVEAAPPPPRELTDVNFWTNEAFTLIVEAACADISLLLLNDEQRAARHQAAADRELAAILGQSMRITGPLQIRSYL